MVQRKEARKEGQARIIRTVRMQEYKIGMEQKSARQECNIMKKGAFVLQIPGPKIIDTVLHCTI
jgi:hypothetical protein